VGDTVTWKDDDATSHEFVSKSAGFSSPLLGPGESFSSYLVRPRLQTLYEARWKPDATTAASSPVTVRVRPQALVRVEAASGRVGDVRGSSPERALARAHVRAARAGRPGYLAGISRILTPRRRRRP
jgi:hypothetical protein